MGLFRIRADPRIPRENSGVEGLKPESHRNRFLPEAPLPTRWVCDGSMLPPAIKKILQSWKVWSVVVVVAALLIFLSHGIDIQAVHAEAARLNGVVAFLLLALLPLIGFPVNILHFAAGVRFGAVLGLALVGASIFFQLVVTYALVRWRHKFFERKFKRLRSKIPSGAHQAVTVFTLLLPGAPFFAQNYTLAIIGVPLRTMLCWAFPLHFARATISVLVGDQSDHLTPGRVAAMALYLTVMLSVSWWAYRRVQSRLTGRPRAGSGRKSRA